MKNKMPKHLNLSPTKYEMRLWVEEGQDSECYDVVNIQDEDGHVTSQCMGAAMARQISHFFEQYAKWTEERGHK